MIKLWKNEYKETKEGRKKSFIEMEKKRMDGKIIKIQRGEQVQRDKCATKRKKWQGRKQAKSGTDTKNARQVQ